MPVRVSLPVNLQRRLAEGVWEALIALAMSAFAAWDKGRGLRKANLGSALLTALALPSTVLLYGSALRAALRPADPVFIPAAEVRVFEWLDTHAARVSPCSPRATPITLSLAPPMRLPRRPAICCLCRVSNLALPMMAGTCSRSCPFSRHDANRASRVTALTLRRPHPDSFSREHKRRGG